MKISNTLLVATLLLSGLVAHATDNPRGMKVVYGEARTALVIGNSTYAANPLINPMNDATDVARLLEQRKFNVRLLTNADRAQMEAAFEEFGQRMAQGGVGLFYYAGHAMQIGGVNYLLPVDARVRQETDVKRQGIDVGVILDEMGNSRNRLNIVVLDACRDNPFARSFRSAGQGLARMDAPRGTLIACATGPGKTAADGDGRNGVYTANLLKQMEIPGCELGDMFKRVRRSVIEDTKGAQMPWESTSVIGDFFFTPSDFLDQKLDLTAEELARYKKLLAEQLAADDQLKKLEGEKNAAIDQMEKEIADLRLKMNQPGASGSSLDQMVALAKQRQQYQKDLEAAKTKADRERQAREAEMAQLRAQEQANRKEKFEAEYGKYQYLVSSGVMQPKELKSAWVLICSNWGVTDATDGDNALFWDDATGVVSAKPAGPAPGKDLIVDLGGGVDMELVWIAPGTFTMGSPSGEDGRDSDETQHRVTLTKGFWMGKYEVTQEQWQQVMGSNPSHFKNVGKTAPVEQVSWDDCQEFMRKLNGRKVDGSFRLPTEAEWEYACRAGTTTAFHYGDSLDATMANFDGNYPHGAGRKGEYRQTTMPVGSFRPNAFGLYDMHGNVWEWCQDWHGGYPSGNVSDPAGPSSGSRRVLRGGSWRGLAGGCRSADRRGFGPSYRFFYIGFRVVLFR